MLDHWPKVPLRGDETLRWGLVEERSLGMYAPMKEMLGLWLLLIHLLPQVHMFYFIPGPKAKVWTTMGAEASKTLSRMVFLRLIYLRCFVIVMAN